MKVPSKRLTQSQAWRSANADRIETNCGWLWRCSAYQWSRVNCKEQLRPNGLSFWGPHPSFQLSNVVNGSSTDQEEASQDLRLLDRSRHKKRRDKEIRERCLKNEAQKTILCTLHTWGISWTASAKFLRVFIFFFKSWPMMSISAAEARSCKECATWAEPQVLSSTKSNLRSWPSLPFAALRRPCAKQLPLSETSSVSPATWPSCRYHMLRSNRWKMPPWQRCWWS